MKTCISSWHFVQNLSTEQTQKLGKRSLDESKKTKLVQDLGPHHLWQNWDKNTGENDFTFANIHLMRYSATFSNCPQTSAFSSNTYSKKMMPLCPWAESQGLLCWTLSPLRVSANTVLEYMPSAGTKPSVTLVQLLLSCLLAWPGPNYTTGEFCSLGLPEGQCFI